MDSIVARREEESVGFSGCAFWIVSCLGLLVATIVSLYAARVFQSTESHYAIQLADSTPFPITLILRCSIEVVMVEIEGSLRIKSSPITSIPPNR